VTAARAPLDRAHVLTSAIAAADESGLDALSMRALAARLGVVPMALYKHVADKDDLIGGMIDTLVAAYPAPPAESTWDDRVRSRVAGARAAVRAHPWLPSAIESRTTPTLSVLAHMDAVAGDLRSGGLSVDLTHYAMHALGSRIWGFSPEAFSGAPAADAGADPAAQAALAQRFPNVVAIALDAATRNPTGACAPDAEFDFTLDLLLGGFARLATADWSSTGATD